MIGLHVSKCGVKARKMNVAMVEDVKAITDRGLKPCAQIFVSGPQSFKATLSAEEKRGVLGLHIPLVIHGAYVDNPWSRNQASIDNICAELHVAAEIGATGVVVHLGNSTMVGDNLEYVLRAVAAGIAAMVAPTLSRHDPTLSRHDPTLSRHDPTPVLWLEIHAAKSCSGTFETTAKLVELFRRASAVPGITCGLCIDSAHLFSCGMSMRDYDATYQWLQSLPNVPVMLHLNDSASTLGSGRDQHACLTRGNIWADFNQETGTQPIEESGLFALLDWAEDKGAMCILEREHAGALADLALIQGLGFYRQN